MPTDLDIFMVAGEPSGDLHAGLVAQHLAAEPGVRLRGAAGPLMRAAGVAADYQSDNWGAMGLVPTLQRVPNLYRKMLAMVERIAEQPPDLLLLTDFGAFNVRLAQRVRQRTPQVPILYYFPPQSWNPEPKDRSGLARIAEAVATPFAHSERLLREAGVRAWWVGHPAVERLQPAADRERFRAQHGLPAGRPLIGLLPGSRAQERSSLAPQFLGALARLAERLPEAAFLWSVMPGQAPSETDRRAAALPRVQLVEDSAVLLPAADLVITVMGTATLEAAVADCLPICAYRGTVAQWLQWRLIGVGTQLYAMPNILLREKIVPELVQRQVTPERLGQEALALWQDPARQAELHAALGRVRQGLGTPGASRRVAEMALRMARGETLSLDEDFSTRRAEADLPS